MKTAIFALFLTVTALGQNTLVNLGHKVPELLKPTIRQIILPIPSPVHQAHFQLEQIVLPIPSPMHQTRFELEQINLPQLGPVHQMWTPKPQVIFMSTPMQKRATYERIGPKLYRRIR